jgi:hypothetical protein
MEINLVKEALKEELIRWQNWHTNHLRELQEFEINLERDYQNIELTMRIYGGILTDELNIMGHVPTTTHIDEIPNPLTFSSTATSKTGQWTHDERVKTIELAHPIEAKPVTKTELKINMK